MLDPLPLAHHLLLSARHRARRGRSRSCRPRAPSGPRSKETTDRPEPLPRHRRAAGERGPSPSGRVGTAAPERAARSARSASISLPQSIRCRRFGPSRFGPPAVINGLPENIIEKKLRKPNTAQTSCTGSSTASFSIGSRPGAAPRLVRPPDVIERAVDVSSAAGSTPVSGPPPASPSLHRPGPAGGSHRARAGDRSPGPARTRSDCKPATPRHPAAHEGALSSASPSVTIRMFLPVRRRHHPDARHAFLRTSRRTRSGPARDAAPGAGPGSRCDGRGAARAPSSTLYSEEAADAVRFQRVDDSPARTPA